MRHTLVTYTVKPGREEENVALVCAVFDELAQTRPPELIGDYRTFDHAGI